MKTVAIKDIDNALFKSILDDRTELISESPTFRSLLAGVAVCRYLNYDWEYVKDNYLTDKALNLNITIDDVIDYDNKK